MSEKFSVDQESVRVLAELLTASGLTEIEYQQGNARIRVVKTPETFVSMAAPHPTYGSYAPPGQATSAPVAEPAPPPSFPSSPTTHPKKDAVTSPMVGTIYFSPEPQAPPFIRKGDRVEEGQTLFIIEAMKVMNHIRAPRAGFVEEICVTDSSPVEFGENLLYLA